jgi:hypothetical protein
MQQHLGAFALGQRLFGQCSQQVWIGVIPHRYCLQPRCHAIGYSIHELL